MEDNKKFLYSYLNNFAPVGYEKSGQLIWMKYLQPYVDNFITDIYGSVAAVINPNAPYKVVIEAHADEISWFINYISDQGYMYVCRNGGSDYAIAPSMYAKIHRAEQPPIDACFGWPAIHVRRDDKRKQLKPSMETVVLDAGFDSNKEAEQQGVHVGSVVTFEQPFRTLQKGKYWVGRALDNRMGGYMIAQVARKLKENKIQLPYALYIVNAVQEEVGLRGARMMAERIKPDVALVTDVTHDTHSPHYSKVHDGSIACGKGPVITYAPSVQRNMRQMLEEVAQKEKIAYQRLASSSYTGTDTDAFAYAHTGTASALLSLPLKYMHTTVEMVASQDVEEVIQLMTAFLQQLPANHNFSYFADKQEEKGTRY